ncbi:MAG: hypothetical protein R3F14_21195 [Polyangiaceae bacterium]
MSLSARSPGLLLALPFLAGCQSAAGEPAPPAPDTAAVATGAPSAKAGKPWSGAAGRARASRPGSMPVTGAKLASCGGGRASTVVKTC